MKPVDHKCGTAVWREWVAARLRQVVHTPIATPARSPAVPTCRSERCRLLMITGLSWNRLCEKFTPWLHSRSHLPLPRRP